MVLTIFTCIVLTFPQVDELQSTIEEEQKNLIEEMRMAEEQKSGLEDTSGGSEAMAVD